MKEKTVGLAGGDFKARHGFKGKQNEAKQRMNTMSYGDQLNH